MKKSLITLFCGGLLLAACSGESVESLTQKGNAALEGGNAAESARPLGSLYAKGEGVAKAKEWYEKAVKYGDPYYSQERLKKL